MTRTPRTKHDEEISKWIPRHEVEALLGVSSRTLRRWEGPRLRVRRFDGRRTAYVHRDDVERLRSARAGHTMHKKELAVLEGLRAGKSHLDIMRETRLTLEDIERIRDLDARFDGGFVVDGRTAALLCDELELEQINSLALLAAVRKLIDRNRYLCNSRNSEPTMGRKS